MFAVTITWRWREMRLIDAGLTKANLAAREGLAAEARELTLIFSSIISKSG